MDMCQRAHGFHRDQRGVTGIEYSLIAAGVGLLIITVVALTGGGVQDTMDAISGALAGTTSSAGSPGTSYPSWRHGDHGSH